MPTVQKKKDATVLQALFAKRQKYFLGIQQAFDLIHHLGEPAIRVQFKARCKKFCDEFDAVLNRISELNVLATCEEMFYEVRAAEATLPTPPAISSISVQATKPKLNHISQPTSDGTFERFD